MKKHFILSYSILLTALYFTCVLNADEPVFSVTPYGYIKLDAAYETGNSSHGNATFWAADPKDSNGLFHATANQTRLGLRIAAGKVGAFTVSGNVEVDFYGGGAENKAFNYMRHAYLELKNDRWSFIAGQYWDIINPLNPFTLNYPVLWGSGNIGYRRPQLRVQHTVRAGKALITAQAGIFRTIASDLDGDGLDDGVTAGFPTLQGRLAVKLPFAESAFLQLGVSGHTAASKGRDDYTSHSLNLDLTLTLSSRFSLIGEFYNGKNMQAFFGGIVQGINTASKKEIDSMGFYVTLQAGLSSALKLNLGFAHDKPKAETLSIGLRSRNQTVFANLVYALNKAVSTGFEVFHVSTDYLESTSQKSLRFQYSWILNF